jgi:SAM-dependent methyltransferase
VNETAALAPLISAASAYYRPAGRFAQQFARGKLRNDPLYAIILTRGLLAGCTRLLDLGCGQGLLAAWLLAARPWRAGAAALDWPQCWPAPPRLQRYFGVELNAREVARARRAFALEPAVSLQIVHGDIRDVDYPTTDAVVIMDVLHYLDYSAQEQVLQRVRAALAPRGTLLLRIGNAAGGFGFTLSKAVDRTVVLLRRRRWLPLQCRTLPDWQELLARCGFDSRPLALSASAGFVNVLLQAQLP